MDSIGETGLDSMRFGGSLGRETHTLRDALPVLMKIVGKRHVLLRELTAVKVRKLVKICAGTSVKVKVTSARAETLEADLVHNELRISEDGACGLCDLLLMATLFRIVDEGLFSASDNTDALINEGVITLADELPQAETYSQRAYRVASTSPGVIALYGRACLLEAYKHEPDDRAAAAVEQNAAA